MPISCRRGRTDPNRLTGNARWLNFDHLAFASTLVQNQPYLTLTGTSRQGRFPSFYRKNEREPSLQNHRRRQTGRHLRRSKQRGSSRVCPQGPYPAYGFEMGLRSGLPGVISVFWEKATKFAHQIHCGSNTAVPRVLEVFERRSRFNRFNQPSRSPTLAAPSIARAVAVGYRFVDQYWR